MLIIIYDIFVKPEINKPGTVRTEPNVLIPPYSLQRINRKIQNRLDRMPRCPRVIGDKFFFLNKIRAVGRFGAIIRWVTVMSFMIRQRVVCDP
jgi:hypothetical protein